LLYENIQSLSTLKETLGQCLEIGKSMKSKYLSLMDMFLIEINEEIVDLNSEIKRIDAQEDRDLADSRYETESEVEEEMERLEDFRMRINDLIIRMG